MEVKLIEVRDRATFIPCIAIRLAATSLDERSPLDYVQRVGILKAELFLLRRAGYARDLVQPDEIPARGQFYILFARLEGDGYLHHDPYEWPNRTMKIAHLHIAEHWSSIVSGQVIDVEFVLGETSEAKLSERITHGPIG